MSKDQTTEIYMNGRGVLQRTSDLTDKMWFALPFAFIGGCLAFLGPFFAWAEILHTLPWHPKPTMQDWWIAGEISFVTFGSGVVLLAPWIRACWRLNAHTKALNQENAKRGAGWAQS